MTRRLDSSKKEATPPKPFHQPYKRKSDGTKEREKINKLTSFPSQEEAHEKIPLEIIRYNSQGEGVALLDQKVCFVPYTAVGDTILPLRIKSFSHFNRILSYQILKPASIRLEAPCPYFTQCGGCDFQHLPYSEELKIKEAIIRNAFMKIASHKEIPLSPIQPSPSEWHYRHVAQFHQHDKAIGFYQGKTHQLIPIDRCLLLDKRIEKGPKELRSKGLKPKWPLFTLRVSKEGYRIEPQRNAHADNQFLQVNHAINLQIQKRIEYHVQRLPNRKALLELFCGNGNLSLPLAPYFQQIIGIDYSRTNIEEAQQKAKKEGQTHCHYQTGNCYQKLKGVKAPFDSLIIDPPRSGMKNLHQLVFDYQIQTLFYLSCNPSTLARDIASLLEAGFQLRTVEPFDMFPKTHHVEVLVLLQKK